MKISVLFFIMILFISCGNQMEKTYPFSEAEHIEILSYPNRLRWDTLTKNGISYVNQEIINNGKLTINKSKIKNKIRLTNSQKETLFTILYKENCILEEQAACFDPRHAVIFYNEKQKAYASIEICLHCFTYKSTNGVPPIKWCSKKARKVKNFFQSVGVTFFEEND